MSNGSKRQGGCPCHAVSGARQQNEEDREPAEVFGEKGNYWTLHNEITDKYDGDMMGRLNTGLDNLLIFVGANSGENMDIDAKPERYRLVCSLL